VAAQAIDVFGGLGIALGLGLLVGLQRQAAASSLGGLRTFPIVALLGAVCALLAEAQGGWVVAAGLVGVAAATAMGNAARIERDEGEPGITTEVALLLMYALGAYAMLGSRPAAVALGGTLTVLLHFKAELHGLVERLGARDLRAIMQFALLALVILPVLPDVEFGPYAIFNPQEAWLMVVLIVGLSLAGYIAVRFFGERVGVVTGGLLGGVISSTATTVSWSRRTSDAPETSRMAAMVILIASTVVYGRVLLEVAAVSRGLLPAIAPPVAVLALVMAATAAAMWLRTRGGEEAAPSGGDPTELKAALTFGALYVAVLLAVAWARDQLGARGLYVVSVVSGLTDVDAITLSVSRLSASGSLPEGQAWRLIVIAVLSNLAFKGGLAAVLGSPRLRRWVLLTFAVQLAAGGLVLAFWPR
jgi:uncharacterized membrane protein (DUF4010 family)